MTQVSVRKKLTLLSKMRRHALFKYVISAVFSNSIVISFFKKMDEISLFEKYNGGRGLKRISNTYFAI